MGRGGGGEGEGGRAGWWVVSSRGKGVQNLMGL